MSSIGRPKYSRQGVPRPPLPFLNGGRYSRAVLKLQVIVGLSTACDVEGMVLDWNGLLRMAGSANPSERKDAVITSATGLTNLLKRRSYFLRAAEILGDSANLSLGAVLRAVERDLVHTGALSRDVLDMGWRAISLRNRLAHETGVASPTECVSAVTAFKGLFEAVEHAGMAERLNQQSQLFEDSRITRVFAQHGVQATDEWSLMLDLFRLGPFEMNSIRRALRALNRSRPTSSIDRQIVKAFYYFDVANHKYRVLYYLTRAADARSMSLHELGDLESIEIDGALLMAVHQLHTLAYYGFPEPELALIADAMMPAIRLIAGKAYAGLADHHASAEFDRSEAKCILFYLGDEGQQPCGSCEFFYVEEGIGRPALEALHGLLFGSLRTDDE